MAYYFRRSILPSRLVTRQVMFLQPQKFALRKSSPVLFQSSLSRFYTNSTFPSPPPNIPSEEFTTAFVLGKYLGKVKKSLKKFIFASLISFIILISGDFLSAWYLN